MKKILVTVLAALTVLAIAGCKGSDTNNTTKGSDTEQKTTEQAQAFDAAAVKASILEKVTFDKEVVELKAENALVEYSITDTNVKSLAYNAAPGTSADQLVIFEAPDEATAKTTLTQAQAYISDMAGVYESYAPEEAAKLNNGDRTERQLCRCCGCDGRNTCGGDSEINRPKKYFSAI